MDPKPTLDATRATSPRGAVMPSPPTERDVALLRRILGAVRVEGVERLVDQVRMVQVAPGSDSTCRIYLVHPDAPRSEFSRGERTKLPGSFPVRSPMGHLIGELVLWVDQGHLRALQYIKHDAQPALTLPPPEWVEVPQPDVPASVRVAGAVYALAGVRALEDAALAARPVRDAGPGRRIHPAAIAVLVLCVVALVAGAFLLARSGGADLDAARGAGAAEGAAVGTAHGQVAGTFAGSIEGELAGRMSTYQSTLDATRAKALADARRRALERRRASEDAATAALWAGSPNPSTCIGYRGPNNTWVCS